MSTPITQSTPVPFLSIEGVDGAGKSSHLATIQRLLVGLGHEVVMTREPGGTPVGERLRELALSTEMDPMTEVMLMMASRHQHERSVIVPALSQGRTVVSDRFKDSTFAFQGAGRELSQDVLRQLDALTSGVKPLTTILFDIDPAIARQRMSAKDLDRFESMGADFHVRVRNAYRALAEEDPDRFIVIDSSKTLPQVQEQVERAVESFHMRCLAFQEQFPSYPIREYAPWAAMPGLSSDEAPVAPASPSPSTLDRDHAASLS